LFKTLIRFDGNSYCKHPMSQVQVPNVQSIVRPTAGALLIGVLFSVW